MVVGAGGAPVVEAGGAAVEEAGGAAVVDAGGAAVVEAGGIAVVVSSGASGQLKPARSASVIIFCNFLVFQPQTRLFDRGQAQTEVIPPKLEPSAVISSPLAHL